MEVAHDVALAPFTTLRLGGPARRLLVATTDDELVSAALGPDPEDGPVVLLAGGSNVVVADRGVDGTVVRVATRGVEISGAPDGTAHVTVAAGEPWDDVVARCVEEGLAGIECLSGIPGSTGATPIQNVGAYGQDVAETIVSVRVLDREAGEILDLAGEDCGFRYRDSAFKGNDRHVVLRVTFALRRDPRGGSARYAELARTLGVDAGDRVPLSDVREAVLGLRRGKGMVLDAADHDTWSAGSFFTNPILDADAFEELAARAAARLGPDAGVKTSAAWLIERAGFTKGHPGPGGRVALSHKHTLALTNRGDARTADLVGLAREIRGGVRETFGVTLVPEPVFLGHGM